MAHNIQSYKHVPSLATDIHLLVLPRAVCELISRSTHCRRHFGHDDNANDIETIRQNCVRGLRSRVTQLHFRLQPCCSTQIKGFHLPCKIRKLTWSAISLSPRKATLKASDPKPCRYNIDKLFCILLYNVQLCREMTKDTHKDDKRNTQVLSPNQKDTIAHTHFHIRIPHTHAHIQTHNYVSIYTCIHI